MDGLESLGVALGEEAVRVEPQLGVVGLGRRLAHLEHRHHLLQELGLASL